MTAITGTQAELLYAMPGIPPVKNTFTTSAAISANSTTFPPYQMPAFKSLWPGNMLGGSLRFVARGVYGCASGTSPTLDCSILLNSTAGTAGITLGASGLLAVLVSGEGTGVSMLANFELELDLTITSIGGYTGGAYTSVVTTGGVFTNGVGNNAGTHTANAVAVGCGGGGITSIVPTTSYYPEVFWSWGTSAATNQVQLTQFMVWGLN